MPGPADDGQCPVCDADAAVPVLLRADVPVHQNLLYPTRESAVAARRGRLDIRACRRCGFVFNGAFEPDLLEYGPAYENSQYHSPAFADHLATLVERIVVRAGVQTGCVVEVGCGKGTFLTQLLAHPASRGTGVGYDPSYLGPDELLGGRARFVRAMYGPEADTAADAVVCRHVIEHVSEPLALLRAVRAASTTDHTRVFFETPCADWIFRHGVLWDLFYEHCSVFTAGSLAFALARAEFRVTDVRHVFGGQYLWAEAVAGDSSLPPVLADTPHLGRRFAAHEQTRVAGWRNLLDDLRRAGPVVVWGAGAKGVTFCNLADPAAERVVAVVDVNPAKQGKFLGGTGHPIVAPEATREAASAVVLNPNYLAEIETQLGAVAPHTRAVNLMAWEGADATRD